MPPFPVPRELFAVEHRFVDCDGARIHYVDEGAGETILLLHGNPTWSFLYRKIITGLRDEFRCVALDYPGYGMSDAPPGYAFTPAEHSAVLERFVDELHLTDLTLMVQDWGGPIGLGLAGRRPELVRRLIIGNTFAWPLTDARVRMFSPALGGPPAHPLVQPRPEGVLHPWFRAARARRGQAAVHGTVARPCPPRPGRDRAAAARRRGALPGRGRGGTTQDR